MGTQLSPGRLNWLAADASGFAALVAPAPPPLEVLLPETPAPPPPLAADASAVT